MEALREQLTVPLASVLVDDEILRRRLIDALRRDGVMVARRAKAPVLIIAWTGGWRTTLERTVGLGHRHSGASVLIVATEFELRDLTRLVERGVSGVVLESKLESTVATAVRAVLNGQLVFPATTDSQAEPLLSGREKQVLAMVVLGCTNAEIATQLHVAETTVKSHLTSIFRKLAVRSRSEASARVLDPKNGLGLGVLTIAEPDSSIDFLVDVEASA